LAEKMADEMENGMVEMLEKSLEKSLVDLMVVWLELSMVVKKGWLTVYSKVSYLVVMMADVMVF
jgi:hypothetical protein